MLYVPGVEIVNLLEQFSGSEGRDRRESQMLYVADVKIVKLLEQLGG